MPSTKSLCPLSGRSARFISLPEDATINAISAFKFSFHLVLEAGRMQCPQNRIAAWRHQRDWHRIGRKVSLCGTSRCTRICKDLRQPREVLRGIRTSLPSDDIDGDFSDEAGLHVRKPRRRLCEYGKQGLHDISDSRA